MERRLSEDEGTGLAKSLLRKLKMSRDLLEGKVMEKKIPAKEDPNVRKKKGGRLLENQNTK